MANGLLCGSVLLALLVMMNISSSSCAPWWTMLSRVKFGDIKRLWWTKERCRARFNTSLNDQQLNILCDECPMLVPAIITGAWSAIVQCQLTFSESKWRCDIFKRGPYFGRFVEEGTRETAFLSAILSAGIVEKIAQAKLARMWCGEDVGSATDTYPVDDDGDIDYAIKFVEAFTDPNDYKSINTAVTSGSAISSSNSNAVTTTTSDFISPSGDKPEDISSGDGGDEIDYFSNGDIYIYSNEPAIKLMESHNNKVGRELMKKYYDPQWWPCYRGLNCAKTPLEKVKDQLFKAYSEAIQVEESNGQLSTSKAPNFNSSQLVYLKQSPNFCQRDITYGIPGTSGRQCYLDKTDHSSCDNMCCGGPIKERIVKKNFACNCKFVWCCHVQCETCTTIATDYYCK